MSLCVKQISPEIAISEIVFLRALISLIITRLMLKSIKVSPWGNNRFLLLIRGILGTTALLCFIYSLRRLPLASATIIQYTYPTFTAILAGLLLKEKLNKFLIFTLLIGWIGVTIVTNPDWIIFELFATPQRDVLVALLGALLTSFAYICVRRLSTSEHPLVIVHYFPLLSIPITLPWVISGGTLPSAFDWVWIIGVGISTQIGQIYLTKGFKLLPAFQASCLNYSQIIFASVWGLIIFNEPITANLIIGTMLILVSTVIGLSQTVD